MRIVIDTRESRPLSFRKSSVVEGVIIKKLDVGDYSIEGLENKISIERKSAVDLFQTLGKGHLRFKRELERAEKLDYFAIVVEEPFNNILYKDFEGGQFSHMRGDVIAKICLTISIKYGFPVYFCNGRNESTTLIRNIFNCYTKIKEVKDGKSNGVSAIHSREEGSDL